MTLEEEWAQLLDDLGLGTYRPDGGDIFIGAMPPTPDEAIVVTEYASGGEPNVRRPHDSVSIQFRVRGTRNPAASRARVDALYSALHGWSGLLPGGTRVMLAVAKTTPAGIGMDANGRHEHVLNLRAEIRRPTQHRV